jgi:hypothetical protein
MWSQKFAIVGISSAVICAGVSVSAIWLLLYLFLASPLALGSPDIFDWSCTVGIFVYPACWFFMIHRVRDYGTQRTFALVWVTYVMSCLAVACLISLATVEAFGAFLASGFLKMIVGTLPMNWSSTGLCILLLFTLPFFSVCWTGIGAVFILPAFIATALPTAYLHRWLLVALFAGGSAPRPPEVSSATAAHP